MSGINNNSGEEFHQRAIRGHQKTIVSTLENHKRAFNAILDCLLQSDELPYNTHASLLIKERDTPLELGNKVSDLLKHLYEPNSANAFRVFCESLDKEGLKELRAAIREEDVDGYAVVQQV